MVASLKERLSIAASTFGPMINWALYGTLCIQTYVYSYNFREDRRLLKALVYFVFFLETVQTALSGVYIYDRFIFIADLSEEHFASMGIMRTMGYLNIINAPMMDAFVSLIVQVFFCYRIWTLRKCLWWICLILVVLSLTQATGALWGGIMGNTTYIPIPRFGIYVWLITSAIVDTLISVTMTFLLKRRPDNEIQCSQFILVRIVRLTIETNTLTTAVAIVSLPLYVIFPEYNYYLLPTMVIGKLYSNTLLVTLNNRIYFRDHLSPNGSGAGIGSSSHALHHVPQVIPPPRTAIPNCTIPLDSFSPSTDLDLERAKNNDDHSVLNIMPSS